jgi:hypothetical protein
MRHGRGCSSVPTIRLLGLINIVPQILAILATVVAFHRLEGWRLGVFCRFWPRLPLRAFSMSRSGD